MRLQTFYFNINPSQKDVLNRLREVTNAPLIIESLSETHLEICLNKRDPIINIDWVYKRKGEELKEVLGEDYLYVFPDMSHCVLVYLESPKLNYIEVSIFYILKSMGGITQDIIDLPEWAGKSLAEVKIL